MIVVELRCPRCPDMGVRMRIPKGPGRMTVSHFTPSLCPSCGEKLELHVTGADEAKA